MMTQVKSAQEQADMRQSGRILATILAELQAVLKPGITTQSIDDLTRQLLAKHQAKAAFLGYQNFPASICISINDEIVHGLPGPRVIKPGDLVGLDFGVCYNGMITDAAVTVAVGKISNDADRLLKGVKTALDTAINTLHNGIRVGDIGSTIEYVLDKNKLSVVEELGGHGVGHVVHEEPMIPNFGVAGTGQSLRTGMTIALEPIASLGNGHCYIADDNWTFVTADHSLSAQFEHTLLITEDSAEILTAL
jgi:methionyl aminopeptidase